MSKIIQLKIGGEDIEIDLSEELEIHDVGEGQTRVASQMAYWGEVWALAERESIQIDALYRGWRAKMSNGAMEANPKLAEWKIKALVEADDKFKFLKNSIADAKRNVVVSKSIFEAFRSKAAVLSSKGAMDRAVYERTGMTTKETKSLKRKPTASRDLGDVDDSEDKKNKMKKIFKKKE